MKQRIALTGSTGFLAWNFLNEGRDQRWFLPISRSTYPCNPPPWVEDVVTMNMTTPISLLDQLSRWKPDAVIHTLAISNAKICEEQPELSRYINVDLPVAIAKQCATLDIPFVHCSSDLVFDGEKGHYREAEQTDALSLYGRQKRRSEQEILRGNGEAWVLRLPLLYGESGPWTSNGFRGMVDTLKSGGQLTLFTDEFRTPARARNIAKYVLSQIGKQSGIMNLGGGERLSRHEMGLSLVSVFGGRQDQILALKQEDLNLGAPRPKDVSLNSELAFANGFEHGSFVDECLDIRDGGGWLRENFVE